MKHETVSRTQKAVQLDCCYRHQSVVSSVAVSVRVRAHGGRFEHMLWCFHGSVCEVCRVPAFSIISRCVEATTSNQSQQQRQRLILLYVKCLAIISGSRSVRFY